MSKHFVLKIILLLFSLLMFLNACQTTDNLKTALGDNNKMENCDNAFKQRGLQVDNTSSLEQLIDCSYELSELEAFFGKATCNEVFYFGNGNIQDILFIEDVDARFPIQCLRKSEKDSMTNYYSVFRVKTGGYYYILWSFRVEDGMPKDIFALQSVYIDSLPDIRAFYGIEKKKSSAQDVFSVSSAFVLETSGSSGVYSDSLLQDGSVLEVYYYKDSTNPKSKSDLIVDDFEVLSGNDDYSFFAFIQKNDLKW